MLILELHPFAFEQLERHIDIVDLLQAADSWQAELGQQTPVLSQELHHTAGSETHKR